MATEPNIPAVLQEHATAALGYPIAYRTLSTNELEVIPDPAATNFHHWSDGGFARDAENNCIGHCCYEDPNLGVRVGVHRRTRFAFLVNSAIDRAEYLTNRPININ